MPQLKLTWEEYKEFANESIKEAHPDVDTTSVEFKKYESHYGESDCYEIPDIIYFNLNQTKQ